MKIGTYYYPEQWPREQWERDFDNIAGMGLQIVHMGEFAWFAMEPAEGQINLDWLAECVELAKQRDLEVILCTPTAAPPIWLSQEYPETLPVLADGKPQRFGGRRHYNPLSPDMVAATRRIVTAMADRFGQHPSVIGWQIDNEYCGHFDQSPSTHKAFGQWLQNGYKTIDALNKAWGCQFWNTYYTDFSQIQMPQKRELAYDNPHQRLDASRFWSWAFAQFNKVQADILKPRVGKSFVTTNFMPLHPDVNPADMADDLTLFSWDSYPVSGHDKPADQTFRIADPAAIGFVHDQMASYNGRWGLMELQPGQVNWSGVPTLLYPGAVRLWIWTAIAHGAEFVTTYRFRQPRFGTELFHHGLVGTDGVTPSAGGREFAQAAGELMRLDRGKLAAAATVAAAPAPMPAVGRKAVKTTAVAPTAAGSATVGLVFDFEQLWYYQTLPQARRWDYGKLLRQWYGVLTRLGLKVQVLQAHRPLPTNLAMIVCPGVQMVSEDFVQGLNGYVQSGGNLVLTCRTALMDRTGQLFEGHLAAPILSLIGGTIEACDGLTDGAKAKVELEDKLYDWSIWGDLLYADGDTRVLARYADQFYADAAAVIQKKHPKGTVTYCGVFADQEFTSALTEHLARQFALPVHPLPQRVQICRRGAYHFCLNYQDVPYELSVPKTARFVVGSKTVEAAGVAIWEEA